ncbi:MAG: regulatory protein GemA [Fibromonadaceae bacterium]|jgi:phage gp16-like protein|nr:regulatory protein GemA [Fibromonadaceae bacterium]
MKIYSQSSRIHALAAILGMGDAQYRDMLLDLYGKHSSKELTPTQQTELMKILGKQVATANNSKQPNLKSRNPSWATHRQLHAIEAMWKKVSRAETAESRKLALLAFCKRITGCELLEWLRKKDIRKLMKALEAMGASTPEQYNNQPLTGEPIA